MNPPPLPCNRAFAINLCLLLAILLHNLTYPLSGAGGIWPAVFYCFYASIFVAASWALSQSRALHAPPRFAASRVLVVGVKNAYHPGRVWR